MRKNKKGTVALMMVYIVVAVILVLITAFASPLLVEMNSKFYLAGQDMILRSNESIQSITDNNIRTTLTDTLNSASDSTAYNISVNANLFRYGWIMVLALSAIITFLFTRRLIEVRGGIV